MLRCLRNWIGRRRGFGECRCCGDSWAYARMHVTWFQEHHGCGPLCETCWQRLKPAERLPYYKLLICDIWRESELWPEVERAILEGR